MAKRLPPLPRWFEMVLFAVAAISGALLARLFQAQDLALAVLAVPIFAGAAWLGMRRSGQWQSITQPTQAPVDVGEPL